MASYKTIKQLRDDVGGSSWLPEIEAGIRLGAQAEHTAIKIHILRSDYSRANCTGDMAAGRILEFINTRRARTDKAAGGLGKQKKGGKK